MYNTAYKVFQMSSYHQLELTPNKPYLFINK